MNKFKLLPLVICLAFVLPSCLDINKRDTTTPEMVTFENYYVNNQSGLDLTLIYKPRSSIVGDSTVAIPADATTLILESGGIGGGSTPYTTFKTLRFYKLPGDTSSPFLTIEPARRPNLSDQWNLTAGNSDKPAKYVLTISKKDLD
jgi:hypothetical protein